MKRIMMKSLYTGSCDNSCNCKFLWLLQLMFVCTFIGKAFAATPEAVRLPQQYIDVRGRIIDEQGRGIAGVAIRIKGTSLTVLSDAKGQFLLSNIATTATLLISHMGYLPQEMKVKQDLGHITLKQSSAQLREVGIVSTGYQNIPRERATGSFVLIDSALINRKVSTNILDRLDGITSGLIFNRNKTGNTPDISVRGRSTIASNANPLIILDNFPYDGDLANINPQDVKSITVLKDAAASSIWGSRAGNGVIVITTHKGEFDQKPMINIASNLTIGNRPDLFYKPQLSNGQFIEVEQFLFDKGAYNTIINNGFGSLSPAVEVMLANRKGTISAGQKSEMLDAIALHDNREDLEMYFYRPSLNQQYQLSVNGGGSQHKYYLSMGYDQNQTNTVMNGFNRMTINASNTLSLLKDRLKLSTGIALTTSNTTVDGAPYNPRFPYERLADENGNALAVTRTLRLPYVDTVGKGRLLDWHYRPLDELRQGNVTQRSHLTDYRLNAGLSYKIAEGLRLSANYTYNRGQLDGTNRNAVGSYATRDMINTYAQINQATGDLTNPVPVGDIVSNSNNNYFAHYGRTQLNYEQTIAGKHVFNALAGMELKDFQSKFGRMTLYGYDNETMLNKNHTINPVTLYPAYYGAASSRIPLDIVNGSATDRYRSVFFNGSYTYDGRYILSASARRDESNLFGVKTNQKGVPLWSGGLAWNISNEDFYHFAALPYLKLRATYGYSGNVNKTVSAYLTAQATGLTNLWNIPYVTITNPPNPSLRWEQVRNVNLGLDFQSKGNRLSGSLEYWIKSGFDLIGASPIAQQTGVSTFTGNTANMRGQGIDLTLNSNNLRLGDFGWSTQFHFNYNTDKITSYKVKAISNSGIVSGNYLQPMVGYSYYALFSYQWRGLDNQGNPQAVLNGATSKDYAAILNATNTDNLDYSGTLAPKYYGNLMNNFSWKSIELSFNLTYKFGYVFRRSSLSSGSLYIVNSNSSQLYQQADYDKRWQKPGDELKTNVPSLLYPADGARDAVYATSSALIEKGDHIRLQDISFSYTLPKGKHRGSLLNNVSLNLYAANLGIVWKATDERIDPDYYEGLPMPKTIAFGIKANY